MHIFHLMPSITLLEETVRAKLCTFLIFLDLSWHYMYQSYRRPTHMFLHIICLLLYSETKTKLHVSCLAPTVPTVKRTYFVIVFLSLFISFRLKQYLFSSGMDISFTWTFLWRWLKSYHCVLCAIISIHVFLYIKTVNAQLEAFPSNIYICCVLW